MTYEDGVAMSAIISNIWRYPVKGLSPEQLSHTDVQVGGAIPGDRRFALALASTRFDAASPHWLPKNSFLMLMKNEKLAALETIFDSNTDDLRVLRGGKQVARGKLTDPVGRAMIEDFFSAYMKDEAHGKPRLVEARNDTVFSDQKRKLISIINMASVHDLERIVGQPVDPTRFRANIMLEGIEAWAEFNWIGKDITCGDAAFNIKERIQRCPAINVNPETGTRDQNLVKALQDGFGHVDMGIFATVTRDGAFATGDTLGVED
ncbi:MAG: MOSC domain-containing protein [Rhodospirillales bacterium]|nr:MOSC domain-containing protein [Rhodospirillales bacterium]